MNKAGERCNITGGRRGALGKMSPTKRDSCNSLYRPVHGCQDSMLCSSNMYTNYRGFFTLSYILLFLSNFRVALENVLKYGIMINHDTIVTFWKNQMNSLPTALMLLVSHMFIVTSFAVEKALQHGLFGMRVALAIWVGNLAALLLFPAVSILAADSNPIACSVALMFYWLLFMKLTSYAHVNHWYRTGLIKNPVRREEIKYPENLTLPNLYYFIMAPTLCYELNFPRSPSIRKGFLAKRFIEVIFLPILIVALCQQWIYPLVTNSATQFEEMDFSRFVERMLKLAIPNHLLWLIFFYWGFHSLLNFIGELMYFADREFYRDWWNAETSQYFWQNWNIPIHRWCVRHLYKPLLCCGWSTTGASAMVFLFSAFFHEYITSVPLHIFRLWFFVGMAMQFPMNIITKMIPPSYRVWGNTLVWLSVILGQPLCILMYYHDWYIKHRLNAPLPSQQSTCVRHEPFLDIFR